MECIFCKIIEGELKSYKVYEDELVYAFLDAYPVLSGHTLIIPKKHSTDILEIDDESLAQITLVSKKLAILYKDKLGAEGFNFRNNNGSTAHQDVFHFHLHLIPRYKNDGVDLRAERQDSSITLEEVHALLTD